MFFASDNGAGHKSGIPLFHSTGPFRGAKGEVWEGGIRAPMLARWPGKIKAGAVSEQPWAFWDFLPTAAELAGAKPPANIDGISVVPTLTGKKQPQHEFFYWENHGKRFEQAVRMGDWKAIRPGLDGKIALYDLASDIGETTDLALENPGVVKRIEQILRTARTEAPEYPIGLDPRAEEGDQGLNTRQAVSQRIAARVSAGALNPRIFPISASRFSGKSEPIISRDGSTLASTVSTWCGRIDDNSR